MELTSQKAAQQPAMSRSSFLKTAAAAGAAVAASGSLTQALADEAAAPESAVAGSRAVEPDEVAAAIDATTDTLAAPGVGHNFAAFDACDGEVAGVATFSGGR